MIHKHPVDVLLVEDSPTYARFIMESLSQSVYFDYHITPVQMVAEAREEISKREFGIVLLDLYLPNGEGVKLVEAMREILPNSMLIVVTGKGDEDTDIAVRWAAADDFISKIGLTTDELLKRVRGWAIRYTGKKERAEKMGGLERVGCEMDATIETCENTPSLPPYPQN